MNIEVEQETTLNNSPQLTCMTPNNYADHVLKTRCMWRVLSLESGVGGGEVERGGGVGVSIAQNILIKLVALLITLKRCRINSTRTCSRNGSSDGAIMELHQIPFIFFGGEKINK